jgi:alpha-mannosidase
MILNNYRTGNLQFLQKLGLETPATTGWMIDSFGHSKANSLLMQKMGITHHVLNRVDTEFKKLRREKRSLNFLWKFDQNSPGLKTTLLPYHYSSPVSYKQLSEESANPMSREFAIGKTLKHMANEIIYLSSLEAGKKNFMVLIGDDFTFTKAEEEFRVLERFMIFVKSNSAAYFNDLEVNFSTPSKYFSSLEEEKLELDMVEKADFFPLKERANLIDPTDGVWSGFYTTRVKFKKKFFYFRDFLILTKSHFSKQIKMFENTIPNLDLAPPNGFPTGFKNGNFIRLEAFQNLLVVYSRAEMDLAILTHHDAITGTSTKETMYDYEKIINTSYSALLEKMTELWDVLAPKEGYFIDSRYRNPSLVFACNSKISHICDIWHYTNGVEVLIIDS